MRANNYNDIYHQTLNLVDTESPRKDGYKELLGLSFELTNPMNNVVLSEARGVDYEYARCFFSFVLSGKSYLPETFVKEYPHTKKFLASGELPGSFSTAYGPKINRQLPRVIKLLKDDPGTRREIINILLEEDKKVWDCNTTMEYPCCSNLHFLIRKGKLDLVVSMRSNNVAIVAAYDVFIYTSLLKALADILEVEVGRYFHLVGSSHFFGREQSKVDSVLSEYLRK